MIGFIYGKLTNIKRWLLKLFIFLIPNYRHRYHHPQSHDRVRLWGRCATEQLISSFDRFESRSNYSFMRSISWKCRPAEAWPSPDQATTDFLQIECSAWSWPRDSRYQRGNIRSGSLGYTPHSDVLTSPHLVNA